MVDKMDKPKVPAEPKVKSQNSIADRAVAKVMPMDDGERKWKAESALHTIIRAKEHMDDRGLMKDVKKLASDQSKKMGSICGMK